MYDCFNPKRIILLYLNFDDPFEYNNGIAVIITNYEFEYQGQWNAMQ